MHKLYTRIFLVCLGCSAMALPAASQDATGVIDSKPASGRFINARLTTSPTANGRTASVSKKKQVVFVNGGQFGSLNGNIQVYDPETNTTEKLADLDAANSVQDIEALGRYVYISADYYILKYDMTTGAEVTRRYTQDKSKTEADGQGTDTHGVNHSTTLYKNWLIATRQNSAGPPDDGYNVRIYNKSDLSLVKKIAVSTQAADVVVVGDSAFVALNGGFLGQSGQLAIIDLVTLERKGEYDFGQEGVGIMQMFAQGDNLYVLAQSKLLKYSIREGKHTAYDLPIGHSDASSSPLGVGIIDGMLYTKLMDESWTKSFGRVNLDHATVDKLDVIGMSTDPEIVDNGYTLMASAYDREAERFYFTFGQWWGWGIGRIYDKEGNNVGIFSDVQDSPERMAISYGMTNSAPYNAVLLETVEVPRDSETGIALSDYFGDDDNESLAYTLTMPDGSAVPSWITLNDGVLMASPPADAGLDAVVITITANDRYYDDPAVQNIEVIVREKVITGLPQEPVVRTIYPNPVKEVLHVDVTALPAALYITDTRGNRVAEQVIRETSGTTVDVRALPAGMYVLTLRQGAHVVRQKIAKE
ncbi:T9SS type A sorting domain-containing protein [Dawidia soli]|uniref:T9SS type A sorting domain-containing protein n=1 Tax=Dawidia soli TaxID=2782352 RepID=A0AAP2DBZ2_9BACT|nr:T9SS type A sorting domain-containing protein [Dawidia soli]MBT1689083.1 T9SS type A sorting domain-containing protein [Dawidia soli]